MTSHRKILLTTLIFLAFAMFSQSAEVSATFSRATDVPVTAAGYTATGNSVNLTLNFHPATGTALTVVKNTSLNFISGIFSNLAQGQSVRLTFGSSSYQFVANYFGGSGNDLVLHWAGTRIMSWGNNFYGQLGNNRLLDSTVPANVTTAGVLARKTVIAAAAGASHSLALCSDGTLAAWGDGYLGNNVTTSSATPVAVDLSGVLAGKTVIAAAAGGGHNLTLCSDGTLAAWGFNTYGQLGNNSNASSSVPVLVSASGALAGKTVVAIAAGASHSLALCSDGTLAAWGANIYGQLGDDSATSNPVPVAVSTSGALSGKMVIAIAAGEYHNLALCSDGTLTAWGSNTYGQLGNSSPHDSKVPVTVTSSGVISGKTVTAISSGGTQSMALCSDGTLVAWGIYSLNPMNNITSTSNTPVAMPLPGALSSKSIIAVAAGVRHRLMVCSDGTCIAWGSNDDGQLGDNSTTLSYLPVAVSNSPLGPGERFVGIAAGSQSNHSFGLVAPVPPSPNADLAAVTLSAGHYTPGFTAGTTTGYSLRVPNAITGTTLTVTPAEASAALEIQLNHGGFNPLPTGIASNSLNLNIGVNTIEVKVTAQDGMATKTYIFTVTRRTILDDWHLAAFATSDNTGNLALTADFDNDGKNNLLEFAVGTNPTLNDPSPLVYTGSPAGGGVITATGLPVILPALDETGPGFRALFVRRKDYSAAGLIYTPQFSADLSNWPNSINTPTVLADDGTHQIVSVPYPQFISSGPARFFRLNITIAP